MSQPDDSRTDRRIVFAISVGLFVIYSLGACRAIYVGDSGELVTAVHVLGIPHPSGYPLYVLLGKTWAMLVPIGSIAFRMSLFSAACAAATSALLFATLRADGTTRTAGLLAAGILAFGPSFWHEANIQRVYALNALFLILAINRAMAWYRERRPRDLVVAMAVCGLGATNHTVMALAGISVALWAAVVEPRLFRRPGLVASCAGAFVLGLSVYAYLPLRSRMDPILNWGEPSTPAAFLDVVLRRNFWNRAWWESPADLVPILLDFLRSTGRETGFAGVILALFVLIVRPDKKWVLPVLVIGTNIAAVARHGSYYDIFVWHRYYIPAYLMIIFLAAAGFDVVRQRLAGRQAWLVLAIPLTMLVIGWTQNDRSRHRFADDFSRLVLDSLPPGSKLFTNDDSVLFALLYLKYVEDLRPDVELIAEGVEQRKPDLFFDPDRDPVFFTHYPTWNVKGLDFAPRGVVIQAIRASRSIPEPIPAPPLRGLEDRSIPRDFLTRTLIAHYWFMETLTWEHRDWSRAKAAIESGLAAAPDYPLSLYNFGLILVRNGFFDEGLTAFEAAEQINPRGINVRNKRGSRILMSTKIAETTSERDRVRSLEKVISDQIGDSLEDGTPAWHRAMSDVLARQGELVASRFHSLKAGTLER